jgi:demethylmenaquinone methyltransferase/2-methoxy-6-polyprenyl-1,4-benzoquinol methylase
LRELVEHLHARLLPGAIVLFMDNTFVPGESTVVTRTDSEGNSFQTRRLEDGGTFEVLKNYPTEAELRAAVAGVTEQVEAKWLRYYWLLTYRLAGH